MLLRSGRTSSSPDPRRHSGGSASGSDSDSAAGRLLRLKRNKSPVEIEAAAPRRRQVRRSKSPPHVPSLHQPEAGERPPLPTPTAGGASPPEVAGDGDDDDSSDEASVAEQGVKLFPYLPRDDAAAMWVGFVRNAKTCIDHYNKENQASSLGANFVYKRARGNGFFLVMEQDGSDYYHLNFLARDKRGHSQLFFGEIKARFAPKEEDVTCCCPVSPSDEGGRSIRTIEEALKHVYPDWKTVGVDYEHCYACLPRLKHPKGTCYVAGHFADTRNYYGF
ncbi:unnamed protein product [Urochloa decumbens]|uniref:DUF3615 domain-containing protein n=1 Tax=Urochloa decumbens TaxID=240449 RepID=A0ABC8VFF5_9POAL